MKRFKDFSIALLALAAAIFMTSPLPGQTWNGNGGDNDWNNPGNWTTQSVPGAMDSPQMIPMPPTLGFLASIFESPPATGPIHVDGSSISIEEGTLSCNGVSPPALNAIGGAGIAIFGMNSVLEGTGAIKFDSSFLLLADSGTLRAVGMPGEISFEFTEVDRDGTDSIQAEVVKLIEGSSLDLHSNDQISDLLMLELAMANVLSPLAALDADVQVSHYSILNVDDDFMVADVLVDSGSTLLLNDGTLTSFELTIERDTYEKPQILEKGGNFVTSQLTVIGPELTVVIGENDVVTSKVRVDFEATVVLEKPMAFESLCVDQMGRFIYEQPSDSFEGVELDDVPQPFGAIELNLNDTTHDGLVWGLRIEGFHFSLLQDLIDSGLIISDTPISVIYDFDQYGDFTYVGEIRESVSITQSKDFLFIDAGDLDDTIDVVAFPEISGATVAINGGQPQEFVSVSSVFINGGAGNDTITVDTTAVESFAAAISGGDGDDKITISGSATATIAGDAGDDVITGGAGENAIQGGIGNDTLIGGEVADVIVGNNGHDTIFGNGGDDDLFGNGGHDTIEGGDGNDFCSGGAGDDTLDGNDGDDEMQGGGGNDLMYGAAGRDRIEGNAGDDEIHGGTQRDILEGGGGNDTIRGEGGNDVLRGSDGNDVLEGGAGLDGLFGDDGNDILFGNGGNDIFNGGAGDDQFYGGGGCDTANDTAELGERSIEKSGDK